ncbi:hypothetical protein BJV74DRAFT_839361 [Russula compacta]|nr:hypothetical protein BJV74DRAFT_839361 [Russula compacta]
MTNRSCHQRATFLPYRPFLPISAILLAVAFGPPTVDIWCVTTRQSESHENSTPGESISAAHQVCSRPHCSAPAYS